MNPRICNLSAKYTQNDFYFVKWNKVSPLFSHLPLMGLEPLPKMDSMSSCPAKNVNPPQAPLVKLKCSDPTPHLHFVL